MKHISPVYLSRVLVQGLRCPTHIPGLRGPTRFWDILATLSVRASNNISNDVHPVTPIIRYPSLVTLLYAIFVHKKPSFLMHFNLCPFSRRYQGLNGTGSLFTMRYKACSSWQKLNTSSSARYLSHPVSSLCRFNCMFYISVFYLCLMNFIWWCNFMDVILFI